MKKSILLILIIIATSTAFSQIDVAQKLSAKKHQVVCLDYSPDGKYLATGGFDSKIMVFDLSNGVVIKELKGLKNVPIQLRFTPDSKSLISGGKDSKVTIWNISSGEKRQLKGHKKTIRSVDISPDGRYIASGSDDKQLIVWNYNSGEQLFSIEAHGGGVTAVNFDPSGTKIVTGGQDKMVKVVDAKTGKILMNFKAHDGWVRDAAFSPDGTIIASAGDDKLVNFWSADDGELINRINVHKKWVQTIAFSPDGKYLISGGHDNMLLVTNIDRGNIVFKSEKLDNYVLSVGFHPFGETFASATLMENEIILWNASSLGIKKQEPVLAAKEDVKEKPKPIAKASISWTAPTSDMILYNEAVLLNACINSKAPLQKVSLWQNGQEIYSFNRKEIMLQESNCTFELKKNIFLKKGENKFTIKAKNLGGDAESSPITLTFKEKPVTIEFDWLAEESITVDNQNYRIACCIKSSKPVNTVEIYSQNMLLANVSTLITKTDNCNQYINYPVALTEGSNMIKINAVSGTKSQSIERTIIFEKPAVVEQPVAEVTPEQKQEEPVAEVTQVAEPEPEPVKAELKPVPPNPYRFALIIGNEDYSSYQVGLNSESNVDFAKNDAKEFKESAVKYLGIPEENIIMLLDARYIQMRRALKKMNGIIEMTNGKAEIFFYYAGHGFPHEETKEPYFVPVDGSGSDLEFSAIKQKDVYAQLTKHPSKKLTVFVDACFSGGARNQGLMAARGVKIKPKVTKAEGKMVVFTASSEDQSSLPYKDKEHGMFTWFLLQKIEETKGYVDYRTLSEYLKEQVGIKSFMINSKRQVPQTNVSPNIMNEWGDYQLNK